MSKDVEIVIGAKNQASKILQDVSKDVKVASKETVSSTKKVESGFKALLAATGPLIAAFAAFKSAKAVFTFGSDSIEAFNTQDQAVRGLASAIELAGGNAEKTLQQHRDFASALQNTTNVGDEVTLGLMKQASILGVAEGDLQNVTKAAVGLAEATGMGLDSALQRVQQAVNGNAKSLERYVPTIRGAATEEERLAMVMELAEKGLKQKAIATNSLQGVMQRSENTIGDLKERIGEMLGPIKAVIAQGLIVFAERLQTTLQPAIDGVTGAMGGLEPIIDTLMIGFRAVADVVGVGFHAMIEVAKVFGSAVGDAFGGAGTIAGNFEMVIEKVKNGVIFAITAVEVVMTNLRPIARAGVDSVLLAIEQLRASIAHKIGVQLPEIFTFMSKQVFSIAFQVASQVRKVFFKMSILIADSMQAAMQVVSREITVAEFGLRMGMNISRSFANGFKVSLDEMPEFAERALTDREQELSARIGETATNIGDEFATKFDARIAASQRKAAEAAKEALKIDKIGAGAAAGDDAAAGRNAISDGLTAATGRLLTRGNASTAADKIEKNTRDAVEKLNGVVKAVEKLANPPRQNAFKVQVIQ